MTSESIITLYDAASGKSPGWNAIVSKIRCVVYLMQCGQSKQIYCRRYVLNFKGIPYKTTWLEYLDIEPTLRSIGAAPTSTKPDGTPFHMVPVIVDPSRRAPSGGPLVLSDSWVIAEYLDKEYPTSGPLFPQGTKALQKLFHDHLTGAMFRPILPILLPPILHILNEASRP
jgi:hypothetical protein